MKDIEDKKKLQRIRQKKYDANRKSVVVSVRLTQEQIVKLDKLRGNFTRPEFLRIKCGL